VRIDKKKLLKIFLDDLERNCPDSVQRNGWTHADKYLTDKGYEGHRAYKLESRRGKIKFKLFHFRPFQGGDFYWVRLDRKVAEKIIVFGHVPDLSRKDQNRQGINFMEVDQR
jgi:hypothetical protein